MMQCFSKSDVMHMFMETRCICSGIMVLMMHVSRTRSPTKWVNDWEDNYRLRRSVCVWRVAILTTKIPSAPLVAIIWLQRTWRPRFRHGTFSYGITMSPNTKDRVGDIENTPRVCTLVHPRFLMHMLCKCMLKKRHNYLFIFQKVVSKTTGNKLMIACLK
jgi:hypothetical protein